MLLQVRKKLGAGIGLLSEQEKSTQDIYSYLKVALIHIFILKICQITCKMKGVTCEVPIENYYPDLHLPSALLSFIVLLTVKFYS